MTVLSACQDAMALLVRRRPASVFSTAEPTAVEIASLVSEVAIDIMKGYDWRKLTSFATFTGGGGTVAADGNSEAFPKPDDYDRMVKASRVHDANNWLWGYTPAQDIDEWITITTSGFIGLIPGWWILLDNQFQFAPPPTPSLTAKFPYIRNTIGNDAEGKPIAKFSNDNDTSVFSERLLKLGLMWRWRHLKGLAYAEDMRTFEIALAQEQEADKGARVIRESRPLSIANVTTAYPFPLGS